MDEFSTLGRTAKYTKEPTYMTSALVQASDRIPTAMCMRETFWVTSFMVKASTRGPTAQGASLLLAAFIFFIFLSVGFS